MSCIKTVSSLILFSLTLLLLPSQGYTMDQPAKSNPIVLLKTNKGDIKIELYPEKAPISVANFLQYVTEGQYNNTIFHRVIPAFMIQGGGFTKNMDQKSVKAPIKNEADNGLKNEKGTLAMARTMDINSATAQFFINTTNNSFLDFKDKTSRGYGYAVFGKVIDGMDTVEKIEKVKTANNGMHQNVPVEAVVILDAKVITQDKITK